MQGLSAESEFRPRFLWDKTLENLKVKKYTFLAWPPCEVYTSLSSSERKFSSLRNKVSLRCCFFCGAWGYFGLPGSRSTAALVNMWFVFDIAFTQNKRKVIDKFPKYSNISILALPSPQYILESDTSEKFWSEINFFLHFIQQCIGSRLFLKYCFLARTFFL